MFVAALLVFPACDTFGGPSRVVLVRGTVSAPDAAERNYAGRVTERTSAWLSDLGINHRIVSDEEAGAGSLRNARVVVFCYNPDLTHAEIEEIGKHLSAGGKVMVFYSSDPELAKLMGMRLGKYTAAKKGRRWYSFSFNEHAPDHLPARVRQASGNIRPVHPAGRKATVIANWEDASGRSTGHPAWVKSDRGFWMTHVLLRDDPGGKKQMLLALLGACDPANWKTAAKHSMAEVGSIEPFDDVDDAVSAISKQARNGSHEREVEALLSWATNRAESLSLLYECEEYARVVAASRDINRVLTKAYGLAQETPRGEFCGVWEHSGEGLYPGNWDRTCGILASNGVTAVFPNMMWAGSAHYNSRVLPHSDLFREHGDQLEMCSKAARKHGIELHVWKVCWRVDGAPAEFIEKLRGEGRLQTLDTGETINWLCPSDPRNYELELAGVKEVASRYDIDGIHLDYNRYRDGRACFCKGCRKRFEASIGRKVKSWPEDVSRGRLKSRYQSWRCSQTEKLVRGVREELRAIDPRIRLSAAVFGRYPMCVPSVAQDWRQWLAEDYVDFVCPMNYTIDAVKFRELVRQQVHLPNAAGRIYPGVGVTSDECELTPSQTIEQVRILRAEGARGYMLFELNDVLQRATLPVLRTGNTSGKTKAAAAQP